MTVKLVMIVLIFVLSVPQDNPAQFVKMDFILISKVLVLIAVLLVLLVLVVIVNALAVLIKNYSMIISA